MRIAPSVQLSPEERELVCRLLRSPEVNALWKTRLRVVLLAAHGLDNKTIALILEVGERLAGEWRRRVAEHGLEAFAPITRA